MTNSFFKIISVIFHPLLMVTYVLLFLLLANPYSFGVSGVIDYMPFILLIFFSTFMIPMIVVLMMRGLNLVESVELKNKNERIAPYVASGIFYGWLYINLRHNVDIPEVFQGFVLGATISLTLTFMINLFFKISAHGVGTGGMVMGLILLSTNQAYSIFYFSMVWWRDFTITGAICHLSVYPDRWSCRNRKIIS